MSTKLFFLSLLALSGVVVFGVAKSRNPSKFSVPPPTNASTPLPILSQTKSLGVVEIEVVPTSLFPGQPGVITLQLDNHSVNLDYDFAAISKLTDDLGNNYPVTTWTGGRGGHHVLGDLEFATLNAKAKTLKLELFGVDNQTADFTFTLQDPTL